MKPIVTIGLPVFNGQNYLEEAIQSIVKQTYTDWELIISDNASTDRTRAISEDWQSKDSRIHYHRRAENVGAIENFNELVNLAKGKYFRWAAHDDVLDDHYLEKCVRILDSDPQIVLCHTYTKIIDEFNGKTRPYTHNKKDLMEDNPVIRFTNFVMDDLECIEIFGLIRLDKLKETLLFGKYVASDRILLAELALMGKVFLVPEYLFYNRDHANRSVRKLPAHHQRAAWFDSGSKTNRLFPHWKIFNEYFKAVSRSSISPEQKRMARLSIFKWIFVHENWKWMILDLVLYVFPGSWKFFFKFRKDRRYQ